jgi:D-glycero-D-manno-heptose 1,7-bisphosphate phosphatase
MKAVFLDRDGTIDYGIPRYERVDSIDKVELLPSVLQGLKLLAELDLPIFFVTNQAGIAEGLITEAEFDQINNRVLELISPSGVKITKTYHCPHGIGSTCDCQKPKPKMLLDAAEEFGIDLSQSWMVGDRETDVRTGINAGTKTILVETGGKVGELSEADYVAKDFLEVARYLVEHIG